MPQVYDTTTGVLAGIGGAASGLAQGFSEAARLKIAGDAQKSADEYRKAQTAFTEQELVQQEELKQGLAQAQEFGLISEFQQQAQDAQRKAGSGGPGMAGAMQALAGAQIQSYYDQKLQGIQRAGEGIKSPEARALFFQDQRQGMAEQIQEMRRQQAMSDAMRAMTLDLAGMAEVPGGEGILQHAQLIAEGLASGEIEPGKGMQELGQLRQAAARLKADFSTRVRGVGILEQRAQGLAAAGQSTRIVEEVGGAWQAGLYGNDWSAAMRDLNRREYGPDQSELYQLSVQAASREMEALGYDKGDVTFDSLVGKHYARFTGQPEQQQQAATAPEQPSTLRQAYDPKRHAALDTDLKEALKKNTSPEEFRAIFEKHGVNPSTYPVDKLKAAAPPTKKAAKEYAEGQSARLPQDEERLSPELLEKANPYKKPK